MMETTKSVFAAIHPRSLFASATPVAITLALLRTSHHISLVHVDALCALGVAVLVQMLANLNAVYTTFHRALNPMQASTTNKKDNKIVINVLSQKLVRLWSWLFLVLIMVLIGIAQLTGRPKQLHVAGSYAALAVVSFLYCRRTKPLPAVGTQELIFAVAYGPIAMSSTALLIIGSVPLGVMAYSIAVLFFAIAFQIVQSTTDAPIARRLGVGSSSLAVSLGYDRAFQAFIIFITFAYGILAMSVLLQGHLPNVVLLLTMASVRDIADAFREEKLKDLPDRVAKLGAQLGGGLFVSILVSSFIV